MNEIQSLLAIFAHPDDESFRAGGTLALLAQKGVQVWVLCATRGELGIPSLCPQDAGEVRQAELECACQVLDINPPIFLDYIDGTLAQVDVDHAVAQVVHVIRKLRPQALLTWSTSGVSGHSDHIAVSHWTEKAAQLAADPATCPGDEKAAHEIDTMYHIVVPRSLAEKMDMPNLLTVPDDAVTHAVDVSAAWDKKMAAIRCHESQLSSSPITSDSLERQHLFLGIEYFQQVKVKRDI